MAEGDLLNVGGTLYGTTVKGGAPDSYGTVFSVTPSGVGHVLYAFQGQSDGVEPSRA